MNVLIVEDEELAAERLQHLILDYDPSINIQDCLDTVKNTVSFLQENKNTLDLIFLDIQLADGKSFEIFQELDILTPVIFTTAYDSYSLDAFELNSIDYLLKPVTREKLETALDKYSRIKESRHIAPAISEQLAKKLLGQASYKDRFVVSSGNRILFKKSSVIGYFFAQGKSSYLFDLTDGQKYLIDFTLEQLENMLDPNEYFRINRSVIIHLPFIKEIRNYLGKRLKIIPEQMCREEMIVSRNRVPDFKIWLEG